MGYDASYLPVTPTGYGCCGGTFAQVPRAFVSSFDVHLDMRSVASHLLKPLPDAVVAGHIFDKIFDHVFFWSPSAHGVGQLWYDY
jgi:hypothetical protein